MSRTAVDRLALAARRPHARSPGAARTVVSAAVAAAVSVAADAGLVRAATSWWPRLAGYPHFRIGDYGTLTVVGVAAAAVAWPVACRVSTNPGRVYLRAAVVVSLVLLVPDAWLLLRGDPGRAVAVLVAMHAVAALATCPAVVLGAPPPPGTVDRLARRAGGTAPWLAMCGLVAAVSLLGLAALAVVPGGRPERLVPVTGRVIYLVHAVAGGVLGVAAAVASLVARRHGGRVGRNASLVGLAGTMLGAAGGLLDVTPSGRAPGLALMLVGPMVAGFAYLTPVTFSADAEDRGPWAGDGSGELVCPRCAADAAAAGDGFDGGPEAWASARLTAGVCPMCPGRKLRAPGTVVTCGCCRSSFRRIPGDGEPAWIASPGSRLVRSAGSPS